MAEEGFKRKLTAILSADVIGYSRLMRDDEEATVRDIASHRILITEIIQQHNGRVVDSPGDNILAEFASVVDAVNGAIKIQNEIKESNTGIHQDRRMEFRIGINLGDVIEEDERIYGDGVNIAARDIRDGHVFMLFIYRCAAEKHKDMTVPFIFTCTVTQIVFLVKIGLQSAPNFILSVMISQHCLNRGLSQCITIF